MPKLLLNFVLVFTFFIFPDFASAHATPVSYSPAAEDVYIDESPTTVTITFTERADEEVSNIVLKNSKDELIASSSEVSTTDAHIISLPLPENLKEDAYMVEWQALSLDDGHISVGSYAFYIGTSSVSLFDADKSSNEITYRKTLTESAGIFLELLGLSLIFGLSVLKLFAPEALDREKSKQFFIFALSSAVIGLLILIVFKVISYTELLSIDAFEAFKLYSTTTDGIYTLARFLLLALILSAYALGFTYLIIPLLLAIFFARARLSHTAASGFLPILSITLTWLHLGAKSLWIGIMGAWFMTSSYIDEKALRIVQRAVWYAFLIGGLSGIYIIWLDLKGLPNLYESIWGLYALALLALGITLTILHFRFLRLPTRKVMMLQGVVGVLILLLTSFIIITTPPLTSNTKLEKVAINDNGRIILTHTEPAAIYLQLLIENEYGKSISAKEFTVTAKERGTDALPMTLEGVQEYSNEYLISKNDFTPGTWDLEVIVSFDNKAPLVGSFALTMPDDIYRENRLEKWHHAVFILSGIFLIVVAFLFLRPRKVSLN